MCESAEPSVCRGGTVEGLMSMKPAKEAMGSVEKVNGTGAIGDEGGFQTKRLKHLNLQVAQN